MYLSLENFNMEAVPLAEFMYLVFTGMPGESYPRQLRSLLCLCDVFRAPINSLCVDFKYCCKERQLPRDDGLCQVALMLRKC